MAASPAPGPAPACRRGTKPAPGRGRPARGSACAGAVHRTGRAHRSGRRGPFGAHADPDPGQLRAAQGRLELQHHALAAIAPHLVQRLAAYQPRQRPEAANIVEGLFGVSVTVALSQGSSGSYAARTLRRAPSSVLQYNLYTNASRTTVWGNGSGGTGTMGDSMGAWFQPNSRTFTIHGRVPAGQDPALGLHTDTITVTVTF